MSSTLANHPRPSTWDQLWIERHISSEQRHHALVSGMRSAPDLPTPFSYRLLAFLLKASGLWRWATGQSLALQLVEQRHRLPRWPTALDGLRLLHISDLHIDLQPGMVEVIRERLRGLHCDLICLTGDYWESSIGNHNSALRLLTELRAALPEAPLGRFASSGNHDSVDLLAWMHAHGFPMLINEAVTVEHRGQPLVIAAVDDAWRFALHDLEAADRARPAGPPAILLSHSPQIAPEAAARGYSLMLSGHTHGGQFCLPGGHPLLAMPGIPTRLFSGAWQVGGMRGYTSRGSGCSHLPVRAFCPPEITLHTLYRAN